MGIRLARIKKTVRELLEASDVSEPQVPVHKIARSCGARIVMISGEEDISGFFYPGKTPIIGVNKDQANVRQRFTIAHELGHLKLHNHAQVHVDREFRVRLRNSVSSEGIDQDEMEANRFAAELLMPIELLREDVENQDFALTDDEALWFLAKRYGVSAQAMAIRFNALSYTFTVESSQRGG